jgi:hypothetical protein
MISTSGWWFGTFLMTFHMLGMLSSQLTFIFFREVGLNHQPVNVPLVGNVPCDFFWIFSPISPWTLVVFAQDAASFFCEFDRRALCMPRQELRSCVTGCSCGSKALTPHVQQQNSGWIRI